MTPMRLTTVALLMGVPSFAKTPSPQPQPPQGAQEPATVTERLGDVVRSVTGNPASEADRDMPGRWAHS